jgi:hypothetical protein
VPSSTLYLFPTRFCGDALHGWRFFFFFHFAFEELGVGEIKNGEIWEIGRDREHGMHSERARIGGLHEHRVTWCFSWNLRVQAERGEGRRIVFIGVIVR